MAETRRLAATVEGHGPRLVLVHGFTQTSASWGAIADDLALDHEVVRVDAPGHGDSEAVRVDLWRGADLVAEVGGAATYLGYSMGGRLLLHLALSHPGLVQRLVLLGAHAGLDSADEREARRESDEELARLLERSGLDAFLERWLGQGLFAGLDAGRAGLDARRHNTVAGLASSLRLAGTGRQEPLWSRLHRLRMPVLVVTGERDDKFRAVGLRMIEAIGPNATLAVVHGAGHAAHLEEPAAFLHLVRTWLQATGPATDGSAAER